jgi:hypothetical protein
MSPNVEFILALVGLALSMLGVYTTYTRLRGI